MAVVVVGLVIGEVMRDVVDKLKVDGGPYETSQGGKKDGSAKEGFVVPPDSSL